MAGFVCVLANASGNLKKPLKPEDLIGKREEKKKRATADEIAERKAQAAEFAARLNKATAKGG